MNFGTINYMLHDALVSSTDVSVTHDQCAISFVDIATPSVDYSIVPVQTQSLAVVTNQMRYAYTNMNLEALCATLVPEVTYSVDDLLYFSSRTIDWPSLVARKQVLFHNPCRFMFKDVSDEVISRLHINALEQCLKCADSATATVDAFRNEWGAYDDDVLYRQWFKHNLAFIEEYAANVLALVKLGGSDDRTDRIAFITSMAYVLDAMDTRNDRNLCEVVAWSPIPDVAGLPERNYNAYVSSMHSLCSRYGMLRVPVTLYDDQQEHVFDSVAGPPRAAGAVRGWGYSAKYIAWVPDLNRGLVILGFNKILEQIEIEEYKKLGVSECTHLDIRYLLTEYRNVHAQGMQRMLGNIITQMASRLMSIEQRLGAAGSIMAGAPLW